MSTNKRVPLTEILRRIVLVLSILVFVACGTLLVLDYFPNVKTPDLTYAKEEDLFTNPEVLDDKKEEIQKSVRELKAENSDTVGFISIQGLNIDYPIVKGKDNDFYLKRNFYKKRDNKGSIFLDAYSNETQSLNWLIYGHNMRSRAMFGNLRDYKSKSFYKDHKSMIITMHDDVAIYDVVAVCHTEIYPADDDHFKYHYYSNIFTESDYNEYVKNIKKIALYDTGITPVYGEQLVTLSTCRDSTGPRRIVIVARKRSSIAQ